MKAKTGDIVLKKGHSDRGMIGIILNIIQDGKYTNGFSILNVLRCDGQVANWYEGTVEVISEA
jgi:hypothetical protein